MLTINDSRYVTDRRRLMKALGIGGAAAFLPTLRPARAAGEKPPQRFLVFYTHHGTLPWLWKKKGGGRTDFQLGYLLEGLESYRKDLAILDGIDFKALQLPGGSRGEDGHGTAQASSMTANVQNNTDTRSRGKGPSFDWFLARELEKLNGGKPTTLYPEQRFRCHERMPLGIWGRPYEDDKDTWQYPQIDAVASYKKLFGALGGGTSQTDNAATLRRKSALDFAAKEFRAVANRFGSYEQQRLEHHGEIIRGLELQLATRPDAPACAGPKEPTGQRASVGNWKLTWPNYPLMTQALFSCDLSRVVCLHVDEPDPQLYGGLSSGQLGGIDDLHGLVHTLNVNLKEGQDKARLDKSKAYYKVHTDLFKQVLDLLATTKDSDGSRLLDNTAVLWCGEIAQPGHSNLNNKWLIAGSCGGKIKTNQYLEYDGDGVLFSNSMRGHVPSNGDVFTTIGHAMGVKKNFGAPGAVKGPISELLA
jgi:hypothetical protein